MKKASSEYHIKLVNPFRSRESSPAGKDLIGKFDINLIILGMTSFPGVKRISG